MKRKNTAGMKMAAKERHRECENLAHQAIDELCERGEKITFVKVAKVSGVSRATLYNIASVKKKIEKIKISQSKGRSYIQRKIDVEQEKREQQLLDKITALKKENKELREQLLCQGDLLRENMELEEVIRKQREQMRAWGLDLS